MLNLKQTRIIDPLLTNLAHGYINPIPGVADFIAPPVPVNQRAGQVIQFGKEDFAIRNTRRAPGADILRSNPSYKPVLFSLYQDALGIEVPYEHIEEAGAANLPQLQQIALTQVLNQLMLGWEAEVIDIATNPASFETSLTSSPSIKWDAATGDPFKDVIAAKEAVRSQSAVYPNSMVLSPTVFHALQQNAKIREQFQPTSSRVIGLEDLAAYFGLSRGIRVAEKVKLNADGSFADLMGDTALLFYAPPSNAASSLSPSNSMLSAGMPSFMYSYVHRNYPVVTPMRNDDDRRVVKAEVLYEHQAVVTGIGMTGKAGAAYLLTNLLT